jgi:hypothetical protein
MKYDKLLISELKSLEMSIRNTINRNSRKNNQLYLKTGELDLKLLKENERLTYELQKISITLHKKEGIRITFVG